MDDDTLLVCKDCGAAFVVTAGERQFLEDRGLSTPKRCKACRRAHKAEQGRGRRRALVADVWTTTRQR